MVKTALLVMDVQRGIIDGLGERAEAFVARIKAAVDAAHAAEILVIYVAVRFRAGYPEMSPNNKMFTRLQTGKMILDETDPATQPIVTPVGSDIVVSKRRVSAFAGSDLEVILRAQGVTNLVLSGVSTSGVVLSTLREAADKDFQITVLSDCCADHDDEVQRVLTEKVFPRQADVLTIKQWAASL